jgi:hypothetical protein
MSFAWFRQKKPDSDRPSMAEDVFEVIADYAEFVSNNSGLTIIRDEKHLPRNKEAIVMALCYAIATQNNTAEMRKSLAEWALSLAYCQKDIGDGDISSSGVAHYVQLLLAVEADVDRIERLVLAAIDLRTRIYGGTSDF